MNNLEVVFTPEEIKNKRLSDKLIIVIDVLRASSTIVTALANGCRSIFPIFSPEQANEEAKRFTKEEVLLGGERKGKKIRGFNLGNSPREYQRNRVEDRIIIFSTTNGVKTLEIVKGAFRIITASFLNLQATSNYCSNFPGNVVLVCAGGEGQFSLEDSVCAGALVNSLKGVFSHSSQNRDGNIATQILYKKFGNNILDMLRKSQHGRYLEGIGLGKDLEFCSQFNIFNIVPVFREGLISLNEKGA